ncbi:enoyl-CoA hydratase/isomerase family protein [Xylogone sp. PMI_703]|nr:enoyl-CoA hydratase/isomerase family protein [Xylogone sp. PMI_703]
MLWNVLGIAKAKGLFAGLLFYVGMLTPRRNGQISFDHPMRQLPAIVWTKIESCPEFTVFQHGSSIKVLLTRPERGNSLTISTILRLTHLFKKFGADKTIHRIIMTGEGKYFCTGMDLQEERPRDVTEHFSALYDLFEAIDACPQTTVVAVNGPTFGGGVGLAFVFDIRILVADATMCLSEVKLGLCPATISKFVVREWGVGLARMAMITGKKIYPAELHRMGTVHTVVPHIEALPAALDQWLHDLKFTEPRASALCKGLARDGWRDPGGDIQYQTTRRAFVAMMDSESRSGRGIADFRKGIRGTDWEAVLSSEKAL